MKMTVIQCVKQIWKRRMGHKDERNKKANISYPAFFHKQTHDLLFHSLQNTIFQWNENWDYLIARHRQEYVFELQWCYDLESLERYICFQENDKIQHYCNTDIFIKDNLKNSNTIILLFAFNKPVHRSVHNLQDK